MEKKDFFNFRFLQEVIEDSRCFYSHFPEFLPKFSSILLKFVIIFKNSVVEFIFEDEQALLIVLI